MSRHRDVRNMSYDDYDDEDEDYDQTGSYGAGGAGVAHSPGTAAFLYQRQPTGAELAAQHHREHVASGGRGGAAAAAAPRATANSAAFFKTKPAKGKGKHKAAASGGWQAATNADETVGAADPEELFGGDDFDAETAAAIEASAKEAKAKEAFLIEAGLAAPKPAAASASATQAPPPSSSPGPGASFRSESDQQATLAALEELRLSKQRQHTGGSNPISATSTPKRQVSNEPVQRSPSINSLQSQFASASASSAPFVSPIKVDRNARAPSSAAASSGDSLAVPAADGSQPTTPRSPAGSPTGSPTPAPAAAASSSSSVSAILPDVPPPERSQKRVREVNAVLQSEAEREAAEASAGGGPPKERLNMVVIGHVDAGKSTLMGHLLFLQGRVSKKLMHRYQVESQQQGKSSFAFAWVLDETDEERARGITTDVAVNFFETPTKKITLLDAPGHKEFIPNMITGAAQADAGILVIPATKGEFEGGWSEDGQIREHAVLARSLGVSQLILAINKLDTCGWSQTRYDEIVAALLPWLKSVGYKAQDLSVIPVSGLTGENIMSRSEPGLSWYNGPVLLDLIDQFHAPPRQVDLPLRMCVQDVFKTLSLGQAVAGKVETGTILPRDRLLLLPLNETIVVKSMESRGELINIARAGDNIEMGIKDFSDPSVLQVGQWLCDPLHPIPMVVHFRAQIITMANFKVPLLAGTQLVFFNQACAETVSLHSLHSIVDKTTGAVLKRNPRVVPKSATAIVEITSKNKICLELFRTYKSLGRFSLRRGQETVACGIVTRLYRMQ